MYSGNDDWIQGVKLKLNKSVEDSGLSLNKLTEAVNENGTFTVNYNTVRNTFNMDSESLNAVVIAAVCDYLHLNTNEIFNTETKDAYELIIEYEKQTPNKIRVLINH